MTCTRRASTSLTCSARPSRGRRDRSPPPREPARRRAAGRRWPRSLPAREWFALLEPDRADQPPRLRALPAARRHDPVAEALRPAARTAGTAGAARAGETSSSTWPGAATAAAPATWTPAPGSSCAPSCSTSPPPRAARADPPVSVSRCHGGSRMSLITDERAARRAADRQLLTDAVQALATSEGWQRWLAARRHFHPYSLANQLLIALQKPDATHVAGFRAWLKLGYCVRKGETRAAHLGAGAADGTAAARVARRRRRPEASARACGFASCPSSTAPGRPAARPPGGPRAARAAAPPRRRRRARATCWTRDGPLRSLCGELGVTLAIEPIGGGAHGYYQPDRRRIVLADEPAGQPPGQDRDPRARPRARAPQARHDRRAAGLRAGGARRRDRRLHRHRRALGSTPAATRSPTWRPGRRAPTWRPCRRPPR